ncbi:MAG: hypothetical protein ABJF88_09395 [Rhodothermales bacterium]
MAIPNVTTDRSAARRVGTVLLVGGLGYLFAAFAVDGSGSLREVLLRYAFVVVGIFAVAPPHVLLPDAAAAFLQMLNPSPRALLVRQGRPWGFIVAAFLVPPVLLAVEIGGAVGAPLVEVALVVLGVGVYAFAHYTAIGPDSQAWQEGLAGGWYRRLVEKEERASMHIPFGLVPTVLASARVFALGAAVILTTAALADAGLVAVAWLPGAALLGVATATLTRRAAGYDHDFYCTNALYTELLTAGGPRTTQREPVRPDAVYWAPRRLRPHVWAGLVQLDRRLPLGRLFALGVIGLWVLFARDAADGVIAAALALGLAAKNGAVGVLATETLGPRAFGLAQQSPLGWTATRFFVNLRWTLPLALALSVIALFDADFTLADVALWVGVDVGLAFFTAWLFTYAAEVRYRRRFA